MVNEYINYFRSLAISHKDLQHDPLSDHGDSPSGEKHFTRISIEEVIGGMRNTVDFPCMCLELYQAEIQGDTTISIRPKPRGAFMIIDHPADSSFAAEQEVYEKTERIVYELLQKIRMDHGAGSDPCTRPFKTFVFDKGLIEPVGPIFTGQEFGYRLEFAFELQNIIDITKNPDAGIFL